MDKKEDSLYFRMMKARTMIIQNLNHVAQTVDLPAFIMEEIVADALGELRQASKVEMLRELEIKDAESVQQDNMEK